MQKTNNKGSILIWAIFLSLIISVTFISISTKINKNLKNYSSFSNEINEQNEILNLVNSGSINATYKNQYLENGNKIIFSSPTIISRGLKSNETVISKINENSTITIQVQNGGPIKYKYGTTEGIIISTKNINVTSPDDLKITNIGGYAKIIIKSSSALNKISNNTYYKITKKVGNKEIIKTKGIIKNF